jgi:hypothetical protein
MERPPSCCDFCGDTNCLREYPTDNGGINWYVCATCTQFIDAEKWEQLIERSLNAYVQLRAVPDGEEDVLRKHVEQLVQAFRSFGLVGA